MNEVAEREQTLKQAGDAVVTDLCALAEELQVMPRERFDGEAVANKLWEIASNLEGREHDPEATIGAIRLAMESGANEYSKHGVIAQLLERAAPTPPGDTESVAEFVAAVQDQNGRFEVA